MAYNVLPLPPQVFGVPRGPIPDNVYDELLRHAPTHSIQTMAPVNPSTHRLTSTVQASTSANYEADCSRFKEDLANMIKKKLGVDMGNPQKPYSAEFDLVSYPMG